MDNARLTKLLALEVERDGGVAYVNRLRDYCPTIALLLKGRGLKLATFLEQQPSIFEVSRQNPHTVSLVQPGAGALLADDRSTGLAASAVEAEIAAAAEALERRVVYVLRQRAGKIARREHGTTTADADRQSPVAAAAATVPAAAAASAPLAWLVGKCKEGVHRMVRLSSVTRPVGALLGTPTWRQLAIPGFLEFLTACDSFCVNTPAAAAAADATAVAAGSPQVEAELEVSLSATAAVASVGDQDILADPVCDRILAVLRNHKRGRVGGVNVGRLLQDEPLRELLAGRDFQAYVRETPGAENVPNFFRATSTCEYHLPRQAWYMILIYVRKAQEVGVFCRSSRPAGAVPRQRARWRVVHQRTLVRYRHRHRAHGWWSDSSSGYCQCW